MGFKVLFLLYVAVASVVAHSHHHHHKKLRRDINFTLSCTHGDTVLRNRQIKHLYGSKGQKGSAYAVCLDGKLECHEEIGVADTPSLNRVDCENIEANRLRHLGLLIPTNNGALTWPMGIVCYKIATNFTSDQRKEIDNGMDEYRQRTVIRFLEIDQCEASGIVITDQVKPCGDCKSYVEITNWDEGCYSTIGFANAGAQMLNLNTSCFGDIWGSGRVVHELGHTLGLYHEHSHPDRTVVVLPGELTVSRNNYQKLDSAIKLKYDTTSVMHYGSSAGICVAQDTTKRFCDIEQHPDTDNCVIPLRQDCNEAATKRLGQRKGLSPLDLESIVKLYGNLQPSVSTENALLKTKSPDTTPATTTERPAAEKPNSVIAWFADTMSWFTG